MHSVNRALTIKFRLERVFFFWFPLRSRCFIRKWVNPTFPEQEESIVHIQWTKLYVDRRNVDPVVSRTSGGEQGRSSWEGGAVKAQRAEGVLRRRRSTGRRPVRKKRPTKWVFFFWFPLRTGCFIRKWVNTAFPEQEESIVHIGNLLKAIRG